MSDASRLQKSLKKALDNGWIDRGNASVSIGAALIHKGEIPEPPTLKEATDLLTAIEAWKNDDIR
jgi:hypothetical protein